jgi:leucyl aminopeptidase (aminopeptidase T)
MYVNQHPLALNLDVDLLRRLIGGWQDRPPESGRLARQIARSAAVLHLRAGHDVVVPQYLAKTDFIEQLESAAAEVGAGFREVVLMTSREEAVRRFDHRTRAGADPVYAEARQMAELEGGSGAVGAMYDRLLDLIAQRPHSTIVAADGTDEWTTYQRLLVALG